MNEFQAWEFHFSPRKNLLSKSNTNISKLFHTNLGFENWVTPGQRSEQLWAGGEGGTQVRFDAVVPSTIFLFIGPESDHWQCLSVTHSLTNSCLVNLIDVTLSCKDANSKLVEVFLVADVDDEDYVGNSFLQIWSWGLDIKLNFFSDFEHKVWSRFWSWLLMFCWGYEFESWSRFWS